jgi:anaerobic nitric oxide reductase transcription regulator
MDSPDELTGKERAPLQLPGLDEVLQELGIYVGSATLRHAAEQAAIAADSHLPVLLQGETGTGKEEFAKLIHRLSPRFPKNMVVINCAAIPMTLAESYLFGHVKGAFTDASTDHNGIFESADGSTLFLDEIAELTLEVQGKLLRVLQDGVVQRMGTTVPRRVDVRIIAASNRDLRKEVSAGRFREDLYFRLDVVSIRLPPLRERRHEIANLALTLLREVNQRRHKPRKLGTEALLRLERYHWPGNVRELSHVLERSVLYARDEVIRGEDLLITDHDQAKDKFAALPEPREGFSVEEYLNQARKQLFLRALAACKGNQSEAAAMLGVSKQAVNKFVAGQSDNPD